MSALERATSQKSQNLNFKTGHILHTFKQIQNLNN